MKIPELRALKLQYLLEQVKCFNKLYSDFECDSVEDIFRMRLKAQNIANTLLEIETLNEYKGNGGE